MKTFFIAFFCLIIQSSVIAGSDQLYEKKILDTIRHIQSLNYSEALDSTRKLIEQYPNSRLGQMLYADLLLAKTEPLAQIGSGIVRGQALRDFTQEIQLRWQHAADDAHHGMLPENILFIADNQPYIILVDQLKSRIYVYRNQQGIPVLEKDYFITIGLKGAGKQLRGDQKTPIGIYQVTQYIDGQELPDLYGRGAFPISYPNVWDKRKQRTGDGIWIHGTPSYTYNRSPLASNGCIVVSNPDLTSIGQYLSPHLRTQVIVARQVNWLSENEWQSRRDEMLAVLNNWIEDWESLSHDAYRQHYSQTDYHSYGRDFENWDQYKRWINRDKTRIDVDYSELNIFKYPGEENLVLMQYDQNYRSNNLDLDSFKEIYWQKEEQSWQIVYEGNNQFPRKEIAVAENNIPDDRTAGIRNLRR